MIDEPAELWACLMLFTAGLFASAGALLVLIAHRQGYAQCVRDREPIRLKNGQLVSRPR